MALDQRRLQENFIAKRARLGLVRRAYWATPKTHETLKKIEKSELDSLKKYSSGEISRRD